MLSAGKPPPRGHTPPNVTPKETVEEIRVMFLRGDSYRQIAAVCGVDRSIVKRYTADLERPEPEPPLTAAEIDRYLKQWRPCHVHRRAVLLRALPDADAPEA